MAEKENKWGKGLKEIAENPKLKASWKQSIAKGNKPHIKESMAHKMKEKKELVGSLKAIRAKFK
jgi:hypothetical protein